MDYKIGSLADLISGNKTPNKVNVIQTNFIPIKREPVDDSQVIESQDKTTKKKKTKLSKNKSKGQETSNYNNKTFEIKGKKRKGDTLNNDLIDSDAEEPSSKHLRLSKSEQNAAGRIKNKINQEMKNSSEYKDRTLFVGNIPLSTKKEKIKKRFRKYGLIDSVRFRGIPVADPKTTKKVAAIKQDFHPDRSSLYAFIRFQNAEDAKKAEVENGELFADHHLRVHCCESEDKPDESKAIFVGNLPFNVEDEELWSLFKHCGPISHVRVVRDGRTTMSKGFGYVNFKDSDSVQLALEMEKVMLKDRELRLSICDSSRAKKKKAPKKPRHRNRKPDSKTEENGDDPPKKKKTFKLVKVNPDKFSGSKFDDKKKKRKFNKKAIEKKKIAKKLVAP